MTSWIKKVVYTSRPSPLCFLDRSLYRAVPFITLFVRPFWRVAVPGRETGDERPRVRSRRAHQRKAFQRGLPTTLILSFSRLICCSRGFPLTSLSIFAEAKAEQLVNYNAIHFRICCGSFKSAFHRKALINYNCSTKFWNGTSNV